MCDLAGYVSAILFGASGGCLSEKVASNPALPAHFVGGCIVRAVGECERRKRAVSLSVRRLIVNPNLPERVFDEVIVRGASKAATIHKLVHCSQSVHAQVLAYARFNSPYANGDECLALSGVSWDAGEWLRQRDMKGVR